MDNKTCSNCRYLHKLNSEDAECRSLSPRWGGEKKNCFPRVSYDAWCGKWAGHKAETTVATVKKAKA